MRVLLELRPALDGHAGIPQETRLLFRELRGLPGVEMQGLIQSSNRVLSRGLPGGAAAREALSSHQRIDRLSRVVVSLQASSKPSRTERLAAALQLTVKPAMMLGRALLGRPVPLGVFDPGLFRDFVWRAFFSKTLSHEDFNLLTSMPFRVAQVPWSAAHAGALLTGKLGHHLYARLDTHDFDILIAETPYPGRVSRGTQMVVRYHDAIPLLMPHTISDRAYHRASHFQALRRNVKDGAWFACVSETTRQDLLSVFPEAAKRSVTIHNVISESYFPEERDATAIPEIIKIRRQAPLKGVPALGPRVQGPVEYLLMVSTIEPRKNHLTLLAAWEQLRATTRPGLELVLVGALGWEHKAILRKMRPWLAGGGLHMLEEVPSSELRLLYRHALATVCPSFGEGFDFSGVEAMRCGGIVVASDIPVHREVFGDAAEYCTPYSQDLMASAIATVIDPAAGSRRVALRDEGQRMARRYSMDAVLPQWQQLLETLGPSGRIRTGAR